MPANAASNSGALSRKRTASEMGGVAIGVVSSDPGDSLCALVRSYISANANTSEG